MWGFANGRWPFAKAHMSLHFPTFPHISCLEHLQNLTFPHIFLHFLTFPSISSHLLFWPFAKLYISLHFLTFPYISTYKHRRMTHARITLWDHVPPNVLTIPRVDQVNIATCPCQNKVDAVPGACWYPVLQSYFRVVLFCFFSIFKW